MGEGQPPRLPEPSDGEVVITPPRRDHLDLVPIAVGIEPVQARCRPQPENRTVAGEVQRRLTPAVEVEGVVAQPLDATRSDEHTSELQSLMRISYADFSLTTKIKSKNMTT